MRAGVRLGVDLGTVRIGVAASDPDGLLATPLETVPRGAGDLHRLGVLVTERAAVEVVVGLPRHLSGAEGISAGEARRFAAQLSGTLPGVTVRLVDERLSTVSAQRYMRESAGSRGYGARGRAVRRRVIDREVIDQAAAVVILQSALDAERASGRPPGEEVLP